MPDPSQRSSYGWVVTGAGVVVNLCLGILYAWSIWKAQLLNTPNHPAGTPMEGLNAGWEYLTDAQATSSYALCGLTFALCMIPGGRLQDRLGPRLGATLAGVCLGSGCILAGWMQSYLGLMLGFGILGGIGMGFGYAAATPAAVRWFGAHRRGLIAGLVVAGYGAAAIYIAPLARWLIEHQGLSGSFYILGILFASVIILASQLLKTPPPGYIPAAPPSTGTARPMATTAVDWPAPRMLRTWQYYALVIMFIGSAQAGLLVIANAAPFLNRTAINIPFFAMNTWLLASFGGIVNAAGRVGTGSYSDRIGRVNAFTLNGVMAAGCLLAAPSIIASQDVLWLFIVVGGVFWQYGGTLSLLPALTADYFGQKNLGLNYGLVFLGWGIAFLVPLGAGFLRDWTGRPDDAFYLSAGLLMGTVILSRVVSRPQPASHPSPNGLS